MYTTLTNYSWWYTIANTAFFFTFDLDLAFKVTKNVGPNPLHNESYVPAKFEVATSNSLESRCISKNIHYFIFYLEFGSRPHKNCQVPSVSCYLCTCKVQSCYVQQFRSSHNYKTRMRSRWGAIANPHAKVFDPSTPKSHPWGMTLATE